jgi:hypothetical protein|nr:MAG TPA: Deoxynucleoside kinase [Caudoviricetes sp.]
MSRVKLMLDVIDDVCNVAESLQHLAESLKVLVKAIGPDEQPKLTAAVPKAKEAPAPKVIEAPAEKQPTIAEVRAVLTAKSRSGKTAQVKELLIKHGADKLSDIDPKEYKSLMEEAEVL